jgi:hypothetical protein
MASFFYGQGFLTFGAPLAASFFDGMVVELQLWGEWW